LEAKRANGSTTLKRKQQTGKGGALCQGASKPNPKKEKGKRELKSGRSSRWAEGKKPIKLVERYCQKLIEVFRGDGLREAHEGGCR